MAYPIQGTPVAGVENPYSDYDDGQLRRTFAEKYSTVNVLGKGGADNKATLFLLAEELDDRDLSAFRALDLHGVEAYECPNCKSLGIHAHPTEGVRSCDECMHAEGEANFIP